MMRAIASRYFKSNNLANFKSVRFNNEASSARQNYQSKPGKSERRAQEVLDELYTILLGQRFKDIVVIRTMFGVDPHYLILATAFNNRHLTNGTEMINKLYKQDIKSTDERFAKLSIAQDWNVIDFQAVIVHLFRHECREKYDIEQLWAVGEEFDDQVGRDAPSSGLTNS